MRFLPVCRQRYRGSSCHRALETLAQAVMEALETRQLLTNSAPVIDPIAAVDVPAGKSLIMPIVANDADGDALTYRFTSSNSGIQIVHHRGNPYVKMTVRYTPGGSIAPQTGVLVFQLLEDLAPRMASSFASLVQGEFYNNLYFHRIADLGGPSGSAYIVQGGDQYGTGSGPSPFTIDDEFHLDAIFTGRGQLAMAKSSDDTNGTQFFITAGSPRHLDFNHTVFGQLVRGFDVLSQLIQLPLNGETPQNKPQIVKAELVKNTSDAVISLKVSPGASGKVTVTVDDGRGGTATRTFKVRAISDTVNDPPFLGPIQDTFFTPINTAVDIPLTAKDLENDQFIFGGEWIGNSASNVDLSATGFVGPATIRITPKAGFSGSIRFKVLVYKDDSSRQAGNWDEQAITIAVGDKPISKTKGLPVRAVAGKSETFSVARFKDQDPQGKPEDFTASINWGDGQVSAGTVEKRNDGYFYVKGTNAYRSEGRYPVYVTVTGNLGGARQTIKAQAIVADAPLTNPKAETLVGYPGAANKLQDVTLCTFTDNDPRGVVDDFAATIYWGDGQTSAGTISRSGNTCTVKGSHQYDTSGKFRVKVVVKDKGGSNITIRLNALIGRPTLTVDGGPDITSTSGEPNPMEEGKIFSRLGSFNDLEDGHTYTATVDYGDGTGVQSLLLTPDKHFTLSHQYKDSGSFRMVIIVTDEQGNTGSDIVNIAVKNVAPTATVTVGDTWVPGQTVEMKLSATDPSPADMEKGLYYWVEWGDSQTGYLNGSTGSLTHVYTAPGDYTIKVKCYDNEGSSGERTQAVHILPVAVLPDPADPAATALFAGGTNADDTIVFQPAPEDKVSVWVNGVLRGPYAFTGRIVAYGGKGNDRIEVKAGIARAAELRGEMDKDTLMGGSGNDILIGGTQDDVLRGGEGRDLLIGNAGKDALYGDEGEDLLISGSTSYDSNSSALLRLMREWSRTDADYARRLQHLFGSSGGLNGKYILKSKVLSDDTDVDVLRGGNGSDAFFAQTASGVLDVLKDKTANESLTNLPPSAQA